MLPISDAQRIVLTHARPLPPEAAALGLALLGAVLAEDVPSDIDMPPYDKSMMDGYAVRSADLADGRGELVVVEEIMAGQTPRLPVGEKQATRIMTGAPMPAGADAVVMVERTRTTDDGRVHIDDPTVQPGRNIVTQGREMRRGDVVLRAGAVLRPQEIGLLATVGRTTAAVIPSPRVAVLSTGDEVVEPPESPRPGQIRNSNGPMLLAQSARSGGRPHYLGIARDRLDSLRPLVAEGLQADVLLLSGGVSAGKLDLTPGVLQEAGVVAHFHKVEMKPGKPVLFGTRERDDGRRRRWCSACRATRSARLSASSCSCGRRSGGCAVCRIPIRPCLRCWRRISPTAPTGRRTTPPGWRSATAAGACGPCRGSDRPTCAGCWRWTRWWCSRPAIIGTRRGRDSRCCGWRIE